MLCQLSACPSAPPATVIRRPQELSEGAQKQWWFATKRSSVLTKLTGVEPSPCETKLAGVEPSHRETKLAGVEPSARQTLFDGGEQHAGREAVDRHRDVVGGHQR